ncbi:ATG8-interacting protein 1-like isoform X5 [Lycium barbarum]|uniref:ATG8-interacting protein 1-like isoform X5 n=1 Tax=Lycium barbarum TaxID=112863 RepID=UPI00293ECADD|nr:ATG8-interacting protein 1-like isoform X5 [Lycium barbarum]
MASNEEGEETAPRGNEWEVVQLTQSAYAAAPGPKQVDLNDDSDSSAQYVAETSQGGEDAGPDLVADEGEFEDDAAVQGLSSVDKEQSFFGTANYSSYQSEDPMGLSATTEETNVLAESVEPFHQGVDKAKDEDDYDTTNLPCQAWWKRRAASLIAHAKDANTFWSIFIAAAVMGLVIIGQTWQQERWQVLQMKWQAGVHGERISRLFGPLSRLKDVIVGGDRRGTFIRGSAPAQL